MPRFHHSSTERGMQQELREATYMTPVPPGEARRAPAAFEEAYLQFAPLLRKIAVKKFGIPMADAEPLVHDVFATYFTNAGEVNEVGPYLVGGICNAARHYLRRADAKDAICCGGSWAVSAAGAVSCSSGTTWPGRRRTPSRMNCSSSR